MQNKCPAYQTQHIWDLSDWICDCLWLGRTRNGDSSSLPEFLQTVTLATVSYADCKVKYRVPPANVICGTAPGKDTCQGDSGGPLVQNVTGEPIPVGIISYGADCASSYYTGVYTSVTNYIN